MQFTVEISYFEIYNEKIHDLLAPSKKKDNKKVQVNFLTLLFGNSVDGDGVKVCLIMTSVLARICKLGLHYLGGSSQQSILKDINKRTNFP